MEGMIKLYDANGVEIGETFARRARQLVKQQRAVWADDTHTAIQFIPDGEEEWDLPKEPEPAPKPAYTEPPPPTGRRSGTLYALAEKRIRDRRWLILHTVALIPGYILIFMLWAMLSGGRIWEMGYLTMGFAWGAWTMHYVNRLRNYYKAYINDFRPRGWEARRQQLLQTEIDRLKRMGFTE